MVVATPTAAVGNSGVDDTGIGVAVTIAVSAGEAVGTGEVVGTAGEMAEDAGASAEFGVAALVADIAALTVAEISGVGAMGWSTVGAWVGSAAKEVANRASMARANTMNARMEMVELKNTESLRRLVEPPHGASSLGPRSG